MKNLKTAIVRNALQISLKSTQSKQKATIFVYAKVPMVIGSKLLL